MNLAGGYYLTYLTVMGFHSASLARAMTSALLPLMSMAFILRNRHSAGCKQRGNRKE